MRPADSTEDLKLQNCANLEERAVVLTVWRNVEAVLTGVRGCLDATLLRLLVQSLPNVQSFSVHQLPQLAQLHVRSASDLMASVRLLAPSVFREGARHPDVTLLCHLNDDAAGKVSTLIDLQLFHLQRAAQLTAAARRQFGQSATALQAASPSGCSMEHNSSCYRCCEGTADGENGGNDCDDLDDGDDDDETMWPMSE